MAHVVCPACGGGRSGEKSCVLRETNGVVFYHCFRASCTTPNGVYSGSFVGRSSGLPVRPWPDLSAVPEDRLSWLRDKFFLSPSDLSRLRPMWTGSRYWYPIWDVNSNQRGGVARSYTESPKSLTYVDTAGCGAWYRGSSDQVWIVEDQVSACKMAEYHTTVALLGVHLYEECRSVLLSLNKRIVVALDGDAFSVGIKMADKLRAFGAKSVSVKYLEKDIKNTKDVEEIARGR